MNETSAFVIDEMTGPPAAKRSEGVAMVSQSAGRPRGDA
jgi:hypothetical protein